MPFEQVESKLFQFVYSGLQSFPMRSNNVVIAIDQGTTIETQFGDDVAPGAEAACR